MLAAQFTEAAAGARTLAALDYFARLSWRALAEGHISDTDAEAISGAVEARRARRKENGLASAPKPPTARRRATSPISEPASTPPPGMSGRDVVDALRNAYGAKAGLPNPPPRRRAHEDEPTTASRDCSEVWFKVKLRGQNIGLWGNSVSEH